MGVVLLESSATEMADGAALVRTGASFSAVTLTRTGTGTAEARAPS